MVYMSMSGEDPAAAQAAWAEFYARHVDYLYAVCLRGYGDLLTGDTGVGDLVTETFRRAFRGAHLFNADGDQDPERLRRRTRAWLGRIAQRLFQDILRKRRRLDLVHLEPELWERIPERTVEPAPNPELIDRVAAALNQLSEKEQIVIRTTFLWHQRGNAHQRLPNDVVADLAETLQTTPENLRQIRRRALVKIRESVGPMRALRPDEATPTEPVT